MKINAPFLFWEILGSSNQNTEALYQRIIKNVWFVPHYSYDCVSLSSETRYSLSWL